MAASCTPQENPTPETQLYKSIQYSTYATMGGDTFDYFTADLTDCYGTKDGNTGSGTVTAVISFTAKYNFNFTMKRTTAGSGRLYLYDYNGSFVYNEETGSYEGIPYTATPGQYSLSLAKGETGSVTLTFPNVPTSMNKINNIYCEFTVYGDLGLRSCMLKINTIPYKPVGTAFEWR